MFFYLLAVLRPMFSFVKSTYFLLLRQGFFVIFSQSSGLHDTLHVTTSEWHVLSA